jgi:hypothetical protein
LLSETDQTGFRAAFRGISGKTALGRIFQIDGFNPPGMKNQWIKYRLKKGWKEVVPAFGCL